jgi:hypothetical protein
MTHDPTATQRFFLALLAPRLDAAAGDWLAATITTLATPERGAVLAVSIARASRFAPRRPLSPSAAEIRHAEPLLPGWSPAYWSILDAMRVALVLAHPDLAGPGFGDALEETFRYADQGELCALYRALPHLPAPTRFLARATEGCRTNIRPVFEAVACDSPFPARYFDELAWRQLLIKAVFVGVPLWRITGVDERLSPELARMALDLADERRSAGRPVQHDLWLCLGTHGGARALASIERELASAHPLDRRAAVLALARAGRPERLHTLLGGERDPRVVDTIAQALAGRHDQLAFRALTDPGA